jgi:hypothetical protein
VPADLPEPATRRSESIRPSLRGEARVQIGEAADRLEPVLGVLGQEGAM